jgi:hypothetical protein
MGRRNRVASCPWNWLCFVIVAASWSTACDDEGELVEDPPDFYVTVQLEQGFEPGAIERLEVVVTNSSVRLEDSEGELYDGGITWRTRVGSVGDELLIAVTGDHVVRNAFLVPGDFHELDIPVLGGLSGTETTFRFEVRAFWIDHREELNQIGFGTATADFPLERSSSVTVEVSCFNEREWGWTCRTGCDPSEEQCLSGDVSECGTGNYECIDGCCVPTD